MTNSTIYWTGKNPGRRRWLGLFLLLGLLANNAWAQTNTVTAYSAPGSGLPDAGPSVVRVFGALILVTAVFLGGVWLFKNWQRLTLRKGGAPRLNVIEVKPLGQKHAIYVVGYDQQRMLLAASPGGVTLLSHLPSAEEAAAQPAEQVAEAATARPSFAEAFRQVLSRKS